MKSLLMKSLVTKNGRDLYRVKLTDGVSFKTIYFYAYSVEAAIEKAEGEHPHFRWMRCSKVT